MLATKSKRHAGTIYYILAIMDYLERQGENSTCLIDDIVEDFKTYSSNFVEIRLLTDETLIEQALSLLRKSGAVEIDADDYAPPIISFKSNFDRVATDLLTENEVATCRRYEKAGGKRRTWLINALERLKEELDDSEHHDEQSEGEDEEFIGADQEESETAWEPIPLDRKDDPELLEAIRKLDELAEDVRGDNGYGANFAAEKKFVLDKLNAISKTLKEETSISWMYVREFGIKPIIILIKRFGPAAIGMAAETAKAAIKDWLKKKGVDFLDDL